VLQGRFREFGCAKDTVKPLIDKGVIRLELGALAPFLGPMARHDAAYFYC